MSFFHFLGICKHAPHQVYKQNRGVRYYLYKSAGNTFICNFLGPFCTFWDRWVRLFFWFFGFFGPGFVFCFLGFFCFLFFWDFFCFLFFWDFFVFCFFGIFCFLFFWDFLGFFVAPKPFLAREMCAYSGLTEEETVCVWCETLRRRDGLRLH